MTSAGVVSFITRHPLAASFTAGGLLLAALGYAQQGYELWQEGVVRRHVVDLAHGGDGRTLGRVFSRA